MAKTVTIYLDGQALARKRDGIGSYTEYLLRGMLDQAPDHFRFKAILFSDQRKTPKLLTEGDSFHYVYLPFPRRLYATIFRIFSLPVNAWLPEPPHAVWYPNFACFPFISGARRVLTVHDLSYRHFPEMLTKRNLSYLRRAVPRSVQQGSHLLTVSKHVAAEIKQLFKPTAAIDVIHPPVQLSTAPKKPKINLPKQYLLFVGTIEPRKNIPGLLDAYAQLPDSVRQSYKLVIAGRKGWIDARDFAKLQSAIDVGDVMWINGPSDDELAYIYHHARLLLYMSHYEGFGMPLKEAGTIGLPIVALDTPTAREASSGAAALGANTDEVVKLIVKELGTGNTPKRSAQPLSNNAAKDANRLLEILYPTDNK